MKCVDCKQTPTSRCNKDGFDCTGGKVNIHDTFLEENKPYQTISDCLRKEYGDNLTRVE